MSEGAIADFPVIHAVTDSVTVMREDFLPRALSVMRALGSRGALHLRSSRASGRRLHEIATTLAVYQKGTGCWLIVNDRVDVAVTVGARGVQLASHSLTVAEAMLAAPGMPLGASVHSVREAVDAETAGASWCVAGTVFETPSHAGRPPAHAEFMAQVVKAVRIPVIAIGGIRPEDVPAMKQAGAHGVATIRGAGWDRGPEASAGSDNLLETRLPLATETEFFEPVTRYISAYDSDSGSGRNDHPDGERSPPGTGAQ